MDDEQVLQRPIGRWLKKADSRINAAFTAALREQDVDRRGSQVAAALPANDYFLLVRLLARLVDGLPQPSR